MFRLFNRYWSRPAVLSLFVEAALLIFSLWLAYHLRFPERNAFSTDDWATLVRSGVFVAVVLVTAYLNGLYDFHEVVSIQRLAILLLRSLTFSVLALGVIYYVSPFLFVGRGLLAIAFTSATISMAAWRLLLFWLVRRLFQERILIVGADRSSRELAAEILSRGHLGYRVVGFLTDEAELQGKSLVNPKVIGTTSEVCEIALALDVSRVVVSQRERRGRLDLDALLQCKTKGIPVEQGGVYFERLTGKVDLESLRLRSWLIFSEGFVVSPPALLIKRAMDVFVSLMAVVITAPLCLLTAVAVWLDSGLPVLFSQERVGREGRVFTLWKFRSMRVDAEEKGKAEWATKSDPRVTRVGRFIRKTRLDEVPQLWNIFVGDMSLVGPRPERQIFVDRLKELRPIYKQRLVVRPGLTGWAQIKAPYAASFEQSIVKLQYDLYYIRNLSIFLDLSILASTLRAVLLGRGAQ